MAQGLSSIGVGVAINIAELNYVIEIGDVDGSPSRVDATSFNDTVRKSATGVQDGDTFEVTYLFDNSDSNSDFRRLRTLQEEKQPVTVTVLLPDSGVGDGLAFLSSAYVNTYVTGAKTGELLQAKLILTLQDGWEAVERPYLLTDTDPLQDTDGDYILDSSGEPLFGTIIF